MAISREELLKLATEYAENAYGGYDESTQDDEFFTESYSVKVENIKKKLTKDKYMAVQSDTIDLTNCKKDQIKDAIFTHLSFKVGNFIVKVDNYCLKPQSDETFNISLYEEKKTGASGRPCNITCRLNPVKDTRFENQKWTNLFAKSSIVNGKCSNVSLHSLIEIIRYLQMATKLPHFL